MIGFSVNPLHAFGFVVSALCAVLLIAAWVILAGSRFVQGGIVERAERVPQLYGYTVCLVALFWAVMSAMSIVENSLTLSTPELRGEQEFMGLEPSLSSFEAFRVTYGRSRQFIGGGPRETEPDSVSDTELRRRYAAFRADRIERNTVAARRAIVLGSLLFVVATLLFLVHWRWLRTRVEPAMGGTGGAMDPDRTER